MKKRPILKIKRITKAETKAYRHVRPNPGVHTIAAINGRGSYSARQQMRGLSPASKRQRARHVVSNLARRPLVVRRVKPSTTRISVGENKMKRNRRRLRRNPWAAHKVSTVRYKAGKSSARKRGYASRTKLFQTVAGPLKANRRRRRLRRNAARSLSPRLKSYISRTRSHVSSLKRNGRKRRVRRSRRAAPRLRANKRRVRRTRRVAHRRLRANRRPRRVARRRVRANRKRRSSRKLRANRRVRSNRRRRTHRKLRANRRHRRSHRKLRANRRTRRSGKRSAISKLFKRNGALDWVKTGAFIVAGMIGQKILTGLAKTQVEKISAVAPYAGTISGVLVAAGGVFALQKTVKNPQARQLIAGGMVASLLHTIIVDVLKAKKPEWAAAISGDAASMSAMYGYRGYGGLGTSIQPLYAPAAGMGEYFAGANGVGEYFAGLGAAPYEASAGVGEYFSGLGAYGANPDAYEAAAGYGAMETSNTNHIDPSSDLDRELSIVEAAAGIGSMPMQAAAGFGAILPTTSTWIPGTSNPGVWAGVRPVNQSQAAHAELTAGILNSGGNQGVFG